MKIYTKGGDAGKTSLIGGVRVSKADARIDVIGAVDEANAQLGMAASMLTSKDLVDEIHRAQCKLFEIGAELASNGEGRYATVQDQDTLALEASIDTQTADLPELRAFILPGGDPSAAALHVARVAVRRAERKLVELQETESASIRAEVRTYLNRLSDWLFVAARTANRLAGKDDVPWRRESQASAE